MQQVGIPASHDDTHSRQTPPIAPIIVHASTGSTSSMLVYSNLLIDISNVRNAYSFSEDSDVHHQFCFAVVVA